VGTKEPSTREGNRRGQVRKRILLAVAVIRKKDKDSKTNRQTIGIFRGYTGDWKKSMFEQAEKEQYPF